MLGHTGIRDGRAEHRKYGHECLLQTTFGAILVPHEASTLTSSYESLDQNLSRSPLALLPAYHALLSLHARSPTPSPELQDQITTQRKTIAALTEAADNGACAITTLVDAEAGDLYVASTGDCRAVAGWEKDGVWRCDVLSEDQMGENPREIERYVLCRCPGL